MSRLILLALLLVLATGIPGATAPAVIITPASSADRPLLSDENGAQVLVTMVLATAPSGTVQVLLSNPAPGEVTLSNTALAFTPVNWHQPHIVLITGVDDGLVDGDQLVAIAADVQAPGTDYAGVVAPGILVRNRDRQVPGLVLSASGGTTVVGEGGATDTVAVALGARPATAVTVTVGGSGFTASPATLTFTNGDWNSPQGVTLTAIDDHLVNGARQVRATFTATGSGYDGTVGTLPVTILDNDVAGVEVTPPNGLITSEAGLQAQVRMRLTSQPTGDVIVPLSSSNPAEGTISPGSLTFTPQNWNFHQTVILSGVADGVADGDQPWTLVSGPTTSSDPAYDQLIPPAAAVVNRNTDRAALVVTPGSVVVSRGGGTAIVQVALATRPVGDVTVGVVSSDAGLATVDHASLLFTSATWDTPQSVVVTGMPSGSSGDQSFTVTCTPGGDAAYALLAPVVVTGVNQDVSQPTVLISPLTPALLSEGSAVTASYTVRLSTDPGIGNTITVRLIPDATMLTVLVPAADPPDPQVLTFHHDDYATPQTVTVAAVDDNVAQGLHSGQIQHAALGSPYQSVTLTIPILDNDHAGITASPLSGLTTTELGGTATCSVRLASQPTAPVTIPLTSSDTSQGTVSPASLTFTASGTLAWDLPQTVTITGLDGNHYDDGDVPYDIRLGPASSSDPSYNLLVGSPIGLINRRVDNPPTIDAIAGLDLAENAGTQVVPLSGISNGQAGENQVVAITATSDNPQLTGPLIVSYSHPATNGSITFTPSASTFGTATITVQVGDGSTTLTRSFPVIVHWINQLPVVVRNTPLVVGYRGTGIYHGLNADPAIAGQLVASDVETAAAVLVHRLVLTPTGGHLDRGGVRLANGGSFTQADIDAGALSYTHDGAAGTSDGFVVRIEDGDGGVGDTQVVSVVIDRSAPAVDLLPAGDATWTEHGPAVAIAAAAQIADLDSPDFNTGSCTVRISTGGRSGDILTVQSLGDGVGQIHVDGDTIRWGGTAIGQWSGGVWPTPLAIVFNAAGTPAAAQALLRQIVFAHTTRDPGSTPRALRVVVSDEAGHASPPQLRTVRIQPVNDAPLLPPLDLFTVSDVAVPGQLLVDDPDGPTAIFTLVTAPGRGQIAAFDTASGAFTYLPDPGESGIDHFTVRVSDGLATSDPAIVTVHITGIQTPQRLWSVGDPPLEAQIGDALAWTVALDLTELGAAADLHFRLEDAPAGMAIQPDPAAGTARITWPVAAGSGQVRCRLRVWDAVGGSADIQPIVIFMHPIPGGGG